MTPRSFQFASFTLDLDRLCLLGPHGQAPLRPKSFELLRYLIEHAGRVIGKEDLIEAVWPDATVTDESLTRCISEARRAIGDGSQRIIKTVPRRGYLLDVPVSAGSATAVPAPPVTAISVLSDFVSLANHVSKRDIQRLVGRYAAGPHHTLIADGTVHRVLQFDRFGLDLSRGCLRGDDQEIELPPKAFGVLRHLAENAGRLVPKQELHEAVWPKVLVGDNTLMQCIRELRKKLGDDQHRLIKMVPRRGYMLDATLTTSTRISRAGDATAPLTAIRTPDGPSIAVQPFTNMCDDPEQERLAGGLAEDIITAISTCNWLSVVAGSLSYTSAGKSCSIGRRPRVNYTLGGTVRRAGSNLRITVQLLDALSGVQVWADRFDGDIGEGFRLQDRVAESVVAAIEPSLEKAELSRLKHKSIGDLDAYELVLCAHALANEFTEESMTEAICCLKQAMTIDPSYALPMALASNCYTFRREQGWSSNPEEDTDEGLRLAIRALEIEQQDPRVLSMGSIAVRSLGKDSPRGWELAARSIALNPNSTGVLARAGWAAVYVGDPVRAMDLLGRAERLNPRDPRAWFTKAAAGRACFAMAQYEEALLWTKKSLAQIPRYAPSLRTAAASLAKLGRMDEAVQTTERLLREDPHLTISEIRWRQRHMHHSVLSPLLEALRTAGVPR